MIYADNAATTQLDIEAFESMKPFLLEEYGNTSQPYAFSRAGKKALKNARATIAECIGALPEEIYFTSGGTESDNWAIKGMLTYGDARTTITSMIEHHAILNACATIQRFGYPVTYISVDNRGIVLPKKLEEKISDTTKLVSIMFANNEIGSIEPIQELAEIAHEHKALFHTDAVQAVGHIPIDVKKLDVDLLSASGHKFNAPKGIGFLYIKQGTKLSSYADGGSQEFGMRAGTENIASIVAMSCALKKNCDCMQENSQQMLLMEEHLLTTLSHAGIDFIRNGTGKGIPGNVSFSIKGISGEMLLHRLDLMGICISTGSACDSANTRVSHVIEAIKVPSEYSKGTIRISFGQNNLIEDATKVADAIIKIIEQDK